MTMSKNSHLWEVLESALREKMPETTLARALDQRGETVVAAICPRNEYPHKYTLSRGVPCWNYWHSLGEAAEDLGVQVP